MNDRNCFMCIHFKLVGREGTEWKSGWDCEPGGFICEKNLIDKIEVEIEGRYPHADKESLGLGVATAATCPKFKPEGWAKGGKP